MTYKAKSGVSQPNLTALPEPQARLECRGKAAKPQSLDQLRRRVEGSELARRVSTDNRIFRDIAADQTSCGDYRSPADRDPLGDDRSSAEKDIFPNDHGGADLVPFRQCVSTIIRIEIVEVGIEDHAIRPDQASRTDAYAQSGANGGPAQAAVGADVDGRAMGQGSKDYGRPDPEGGQLASTCENGSIPDLHSARRRQG